MSKVKNFISRLFNLTYQQVWLSGENPIRNKGYNVTTAESVATIAGCVSVLSELVAVLPLFVYERSGDNRSKAKDHPLYKVLHDRPNSWQTSFEWRQGGMRDLIYHGNFICEVVRKNREVVSLEPLKPQFSVKREGEFLLYEVENFEGKKQWLTSKEVFHVRAVPTHGYDADSPLKNAGKTIDLAVKAEDYSASVFDSGGTKRVALELPPGVKLEPDAREELSRAFDKTHGASAKTAVLEGGMKPTVIGMDPDSTQYIECRKYQSIELCRILRIPPHMVADLDRATFSNISHQDLMLIKYTLWPWLERWEQAISRDLISDTDKYYSEFELKGLLKADPVSRAAFYRTLKQQGIATTNELRPYENMDSIEGGDELWRPVNMALAGEPINEEQTELVQDS